MNRNEETLELLRALNHTTVMGRSVEESTIIGRYSAWSMWQTDLWSMLLGHVSAQNNQGDNKIRGESIWRVWLIRFFLIFISVVSVLYSVFRKPKILLFSMDIVSGSQRCDGRIEEAYVYLKKNRVSYLEIIHANIGKRVIFNFLRRRRPVIYLEALEALYGLLICLNIIKPIPTVDLKSIFIPDVLSHRQSELQSFVAELLNRFGIAKFRISVLSKLIKILRIKYVVGIDDTRHWGEIIFAATSMGIQFIALQHGRFNRYMVGSIFYGLCPENCVIPDIYIVWSDFWRNKLESLSSVFRRNSRNILVGGKPFVTRVGSDLLLTRDDILTIFWPFEPRAISSEMTIVMDTLLSREDVLVVYKIRQDHSREEQLAGLSEYARSSNRLMVVSTLTRDLLSSFDVAIGTYSTMLYEMAEAGVPIGIIKSSTTQADDLVEDGLMAAYLDNDNIMSTIDMLASHTASERKRQRNNLATTKHISDTFTELLK